MSSWKGWKGGDDINMEDLSLHILDIVENSIRASAKNVEIKLIEDEKKNLMTLEIIDNGEGMDEDTKKQVTDPFFTTKHGKKVGFGLPFLAQSAEEACGKIKIGSEKGKGTKITASFELDHIDKKPLGNTDKTIECLKAAHPEINFSFDYIKLNSGGHR